jgi:hypothetical protein
MHISIMAGTLMLALSAPLVSADSTSSQTSTYSTTTQSVPAEPVYSSSRTEQHLDEHGNVIKKTQTLNSTDPASGDANSSSSTTISRPDGSQSTVEQARVRSSADGSTSVTEKRTTTTTD